MRTLKEIRALTVEGRQKLVPAVEEALASVLEQCAFDAGTGLSKSTISNNTHLMSLPVIEGVMVRLRELGFAVARVSRVGGDADLWRGPQLIVGWEETPRPAPPHAG